ncbi:MAG: ribonuclease Z [Candidatus Altiarchaeota archaeon]|nr:ribonuclease Z [Candidatus Altiarchaeota archaeon]
MIEVTILGTGATRPTVRRFTTALVVRHEGEVFLFDCGEGVQVRLSQSGFSLMKIDKIFITHFHGDHILGLPGILFSMAKNERKKAVEVYGPVGTERIVNGLISLGFGRIPFDVKVHEIHPGQSITGKLNERGTEYSIDTFKTRHTKESIGYVFREKGYSNIDKEKMKKEGIKSNPKFAELKNGKEVTIDGVLFKPEDWLIEMPGASVAYTGDTMKAKSVIDAVKGVDVLLHESTFNEEDRGKFDWGHSSARDAAEVAKEAEVKHLYIIHFSHRYKSIKPLLAEALPIFENSYIAEDLHGFVLKKGSFTQFKPKGRV